MDPTSITPVNAREANAFFGVFKGGWAPPQNPYAYASASMTPMPGGFPLAAMPGMSGAQMPIAFQSTGGIGRMGMSGMSTAIQPVGPMSVQPMGSFLSSIRPVSSEYNPMDEIVRAAESQVDITTPEGQAYVRRLKCAIDPKWNESVQIIAAHVESLSMQKNPKGVLFGDEGAFNAWVNAMLRLHNPGASRGFDISSFFSHLQAQSGRPRQSYNDFVQRQMHSYDVSTPQNAELKPIEDIPDFSSGIDWVGELSNMEGICPGFCMKLANTIQLRKSVQDRMQATVGGLFSGGGSMEGSFGGTMASL